MTTDLLDLPAIDETLIDAPTAPLAPTTAVATAAAQAIDPAKADLQVIALAHFGDWRGTVKTATDKFTGLVLDLSNQSKIDDAKKLRWRLVGIPRADARKVAKELKSKLSKVSKAIGAEEEAIVAALDAAEAIINQQIEPAEAKLQAERDEKARIDRERVAALDAKLASLSNWIERCKEPGITAERIANGIKALHMLELDPDEWQGHLSRALVRRAEVVDVMRQIHMDTLAAEMRTAELERQRVENERIAAEQAEHQRRINEQAAELVARERQARAITAFGTALAAAIARVGIAKVTTVLPDVGARTDLLTPDEMESNAAALDALQPDPITQDDQESGSSPADAPASVDAPSMCASSAAESAEAAPSGDEGEGAHADERAPEPACVVNMPALETSEGEAVHIRTEDLPALATPEPDIITLCWQLVQVLKTPYAGRFPSHPKPGPEWWADVRSRIDVIEPRLAAMQGGE